MRSKIIFFILVCIGASTCYAQQTLKKIVVHSKTNEPLTYVSIKTNIAGINLMTSNSGEFLLLKDTSIKKFHFYKLGFQPLTLSVNQLAVQDTIYLNERAIVLEEVAITNSKIDVLVKNKRFYVEDYAVLENGCFLILTSRLDREGVDLYFYNRFKEVKKVRSIKNEGEAYIKKDCLSYYHLVTKNHSRQIFFDTDSSFEFLPSFERRQFDSVITPCLLKIDTGIIVKKNLPLQSIALADFNVTVHPSVLSYYRLSKGQTSHFYTSTFNAGLREMWENEMRDWGLMPADRNERIANRIRLFYDKVAGPIYAPLFKLSDTIILMDFQEKNIIFLSQAGVLIRTVKLNEKQFSTLHEYEVLQDPVSQNFYYKSKEKEKAFLKKINIYSGDVSQTIPLEKYFANNVKIVNGRIYYLVREHGWDDTQYLYRQN